MPPPESLQEPNPNLSKEREDSSIPQPNGSRWIYPSPLMFFNALKRKGYDTEPEDVDVMVSIHNSLNEQTWNQLLQVEQKLHPSGDEIYLVEFKGRPQEPTPKAFFYSFLGVHTFDRHDWTIKRGDKLVRYVIDYYDTGENGINVDLRPALDSFGSIFDRIKMLFW